MMILEQSPTRDVATWGNVTRKLINLAPHFHIRNVKIYVKILSLSVSASPPLYRRSLPPFSRVPSLSALHFFTRGITYIDSTWPHGHRCHAARHVQRALLSGLLSFKTLPLLLRTMHFATTPKTARVSTPKLSKHKSCVRNTRLLIRYLIDRRHARE